TVAGAPTTLGTPVTEDAAAPAGEARGAMRGGAELAVELRVLVAVEQNVAAVVEVGEVDVSEGDGDVVAGWRGGGRWFDAAAAHNDQRRDDRKDEDGASRNTQESTLRHKGAP